MLSQPTCAVKQIASALRHVLEPGQVTELRAVGVRTPEYRGRHVEAGFFDSDHVEAMASEALRLTKYAQGVYFTLNPLHPDIVHRCYNRVRVAGEGELAKDEHVLYRRWLFVDTDAERRFSDISTTDAEKGSAWETIQAIRDHLRGRGWPGPILADSGNGFHLLYRVDLPADDGGLVQRALQALAKRFDTDKVTVDTSVCNPARICKFPGTVARKGDSTPQRPHRTARFLEVPR
jgi:hypothetical protein